MKYRVFIAEDNPTICKGIALSVDTVANPVEVCGLAHNGEDAQQKILDLKPHILITDIRMPKCSGIDLINWLQDNAPETKVIIISSYDDFSYMRRAVQLNCIDYLLKPIDPQELNNAISHSIQNLQSSSLSSGINSFLAPVLQECLLGNVTNVYKLPSKIREGSFCVVSAIWKNPEDQKHFQDALRLKSVIAISETSCCNYIFWDSESELNLGKLRAFLNNTIVEHSIPYPFIGMGDICNGPQDLQDSKCRAQSALMYGKLFHCHTDNNRIYSASELPVVVFPNNLSEQVPEFSYYFSANDEVRLFNFMEKCVANATANSSTFEVFHFVISYFVSQAANMPGVQPDEKTLQKLLSRAWYLSQESMQSATKEVTRLISKWSRHTAIQYGETRLEISDVVAFIAQNYASPITLDSIASAFHLSPNYFATQFKRLTGHTVLQEITNVRMERAKLLLSTTNLPMNQIAIAVGYQNAEYFFRVFRKTIGVTPGKYRNSTKGTEKNEK